MGLSLFIAGQFYCFLQCYPLSTTGAGYTHAAVCIKRHVIVPAGLQAVSENQSFCGYPVFSGLLCGTGVYEYKNRRGCLVVHCQFSI